MGTRNRNAGVTVVVSLAVAMLGCAMKLKGEEKTAKAMPVNCATADGDVRVLQGEKAHVAERIAMGVSMIYPAGAVVGILTGTEGTKYQVATGEYNAAIDAKIAEIKRECAL